MAATTIMVAVPLIERDVNLLPGWVASINAVAAAHLDTAFIPCAAIRVGDDAAAEAVASAGIQSVTIPWYSVRPGMRQHHVGVMLARLKLARTAQQQRAVAVWYVDVDVRPLPSTWQLVDELFRAGKPVVVVPYPRRWSNGEPTVFCVDGTSASLNPVMADSRNVRPVAGESSAIIAGGGFGCTAIITTIVCMVSFIVRDLSMSIEELLLPDLGRDVGWFLNAHRAGIEVRMPLNHTVDHVGVAMADAKTSVTPAPTTDDVT